MISAERFYGGDRIHIADGSAVDLKRGYARVYRFAAGTTNGDVNLEDATTLPLLPGSPVYMVINETGLDLTIKDSAGGTVATVSDQTGCKLCLVDNATAAGVWMVICGPIQTVTGTTTTTTSSTTLTTTTSTTTLTTTSTTTLTTTSSTKTTTTSSTTTETTNTPATV